MLYEFLKKTMENCLENLWNDLRKISEESFGYISDGIPGRLSNAIPRKFAGALEKLRKKFAEAFLKES